MSFSKHLLCFILLFFNFYHSAYSNQSILLNTVDRLPVGIHFVTSCGEWEHNDQFGYYRVILGKAYNGGGTEVYAQWVVNPIKNKPRYVLKTLGFSELNNEGARYYFDSAQCIKIDNHYYVKLKGSFEHDERKHEFLIQLIDVGSYKLNEKIINK